MSTLSKVFLVFVFLASLGLLWASARMLKTWSVWRGRYNEHMVKIHEVQDQIRPMEEGDSSNEKLRQQLHSLITHRGRVWFNCNPTGIDQQTGTVAVRSDLPNPPGISVGDVLYAFQAVEENAPGQGIGNRRFVGEFKATAAGPAALDNANPNLSLTPTRTLTPAEIKLLQSRVGPWILYEAMPPDSHEVFADLDEAQIRALIPAPQDPELARYVEAIVQEHLRHGKEAAPDDPPERVLVTVKFVKDFVDLDAASVQIIEENKIDNKLVVKDGTATFTADVADQLITAEIAEQQGKRVYDRRLRDYRTEFDEYARVLPKLRNAIAAAATDRDSTLAAAMQAETYLDEREQLRMALEAEQTRLGEEFEAVMSYRQQLDAELAAYEKDVEALERRNRELAAEWKRLQTEAARRIEERATAQASR